jgi:N-acetylmuramoyl-L-alanine amidase
MKKHLVLVVGHNERAQGAQRVDNGETEFSFNQRIAARAKTIARNSYPNLGVTVLLRRHVGSNRREILTVYQEADRIGADVTIDLHFNSFDTPAAGGCEVRHAGSRRGSALAQHLYDRILRAFPDLRRRGLQIPEGHNDGLTNVTAGRAPAALVEPFFGSNRGDCEMFETADQERALAQAYVDGAVAALKDWHPEWEPSASATQATPKPRPWWARFFNLFRKG